MNNKMRIEIDKAISTLEDVKAVISSLAEEEREKFENLTEGLQAGEKGIKIDEAATALESADNGLDEVIQYLEEAKG